MRKAQSRARLALVWIALSAGCAAPIDGVEMEGEEEVGAEQEVGVSSEGLRIESCPEWQIRNIAAASREAAKMLARKPSDRQFEKWFGVKRGDPNFATFSRLIDDLRNQMWDHVASLGAAARPNPQFRVTCGCIDEDRGGEQIDGAKTSFRICDGFTSMPLTGADSQAGTLIHEMMHLLGAVDLNASLRDGDMTNDIPDLSFSAAVPIVWGPFWAWMNASNHEYFYENPDRF